MAKYIVKTREANGNREVNSLNLMSEASECRATLDGMGFHFNDVPSEVMVKLLEVLAE